MALRTFDPGLAYDKATGRGIGSTLAIVTDAVTREPVDTFDMDGNLAPVITNRDGYIGQFQADADRVRVKVSNLTMEAVNLDASLGLADSAAAAATAAFEAVTAAQEAIVAARAAARVTGISLGADGIPYLDPAGTVPIAIAADGTPYLDIVNVIVGANGIPYVS